MNSRTSIALSFTAGVVVGTVLTALIDVPVANLPKPVPAEPGQALGAMPRSREHAAVLSWIFEHRTDAPCLEFLTWSPPRQVSENPFTKSPATLVKLVVKNRGGGDASLEHLFFYLRNLEVLGSVKKAHGDPMAIWLS